MDIQEELKLSIALSVRWPDNVRLEMVEKSIAYDEPRIYEYGYYDGYQKLRDVIAPEYIKLSEENKQLREALRKVANWEMPSTGEFWDKEKTRPITYGSKCGSNGERDYIISVANKALAQ